MSQKRFDINPYFTKEDMSMRKAITQAIMKLADHDIEPVDIELNMSSSQRVSDWLMINEPDDYINSCYIEITMNLANEEGEDSDNSENAIVVGNAICYYINVYSQATDTFVDIADITESHDGDLFTAVSPLLNKEGLLKEEFGLAGFNVLYIDKFYILPEYRGKGIGQLVLPMIIDLLGQGCGAATIIPAPTEDNGEERLEKTDPRYNKVMKQMTNLLEKNGFNIVNVQDHVWAKSYA